MSPPGKGSFPLFPQSGWGCSSVPDAYLLPSPLPQWREERFRQTSESTNQRVLWWSILQTFILVATGVWQMQHLKSFFKAKKLV